MGLEKKPLPLIWQPSEPQGSVQPHCKCPWPCHLLLLWGVAHGGIRCDALIPFHDIYCDKWLRSVLIVCFPSQLSPSPAFHGVVLPGDHQCLSSPHCSALWSLCLVPSHSSLIVPPIRIIPTPQCSAYVSHIFHTMLFQSILIKQEIHEYNLLVMM